jgi:glutathione synthase/RimK-type ligase-like ATP-grasp enzyme
MTAQRNKRVVAISHPSDAHLLFVEKHLPQPFILLDQTAIIAGRSLTLDLSSRDDLRVLMDQQEIRDVCGVWYRRPESFQPDQLLVEPDLKAYSIAALREFGILFRTLFPDANWVSDYYAIRKAEDKALQLTLARKLGFNVPDTIVTSDEAAARHFIRSHRSVITKPIQAEFFVRKDATYNFYTKKIDKTTDLTGLNLAPAIFQSALDASLDLRITVIGDQVFAASIQENNTDTDSAVRDWRIGIYKGGMTIRAYDLPPDIAAKCIALVHKLGLKFGAIDMILDNAGKYWFLENNPNGQWAFVEEATNQPMGKALAELLMSSTS